MVWNNDTRTFDVVTEHGDVIIRPATANKKPKENESVPLVSAYRVVSETKVNGYLYVTVEFLYEDGTLYDSSSYIFAGNRYWYQENGVWMGSPNFEVGSWSAGALPLPTLTPPTPSGDGGEGGEHAH
jgi:hypothetical protein